MNFVGLASIFAVLLIPTILSIVVGTFVLEQILQEPGRELNMMPGSGRSAGEEAAGSIEIVNLADRYTVPDTLSVQVRVSDERFECGDLRIAIYNIDSPQDEMASGSFSDQCFLEDGALLPVGGGFVADVDSPGTYEVMAEMSIDGLEAISGTSEFTALG